MTGPDLTPEQRETFTSALADADSNRTPERMADRMKTRPQDWAAPARLHLFGAQTLSDQELASETRRLQVLTSAGNRPGADVRRMLAEREMQRRRLS